MPHYLQRICSAGMRTTAQARPLAVSSPAMTLPILSPWMKTSLKQEAGLPDSDEFSPAANTGSSIAEAITPFPPVSLKTENQPVSAPTEGTTAGTQLNQPVQTLSADIPVIRIQAPPGLRERLVSSVSSDKQIEKETSNTAIPNGNKMQAPAPPQFPADLQRGMADVQAPAPSPVRETNRALHVESVPLTQIEAAPAIQAPVSKEALATKNSNTENSDLRLDAQPKRISGPQPDDIHPAPIPVLEITNRVTGLPIAAAAEQKHISIGRIEVQVNNAANPVNNQPVIPRGGTQMKSVDTQFFSRFALKL